MDEFTSIFYVPAESYRFIGSSAIVFIALTSILIRFLSTRFVEIAEILEHHGLIGGGVYSFSYLVLGPTVSFVAISSIMVDYILTACISAVSAVLNASSFFPALSNSPHLVMTLVFVSIWFVAGLNILGIRDNVRFTFAIFMFAALVILNLLASGFLNLDQGSMERIRVSGHVSLGIGSRRLVAQTPMAASSRISPSVFWPTRGSSQSSKRQVLLKTGGSSRRPMCFWP